MRLEWTLGNGRHVGGFANTRRSTRVNAPAVNRVERQEDAQGLVAAPPADRFGDNSGNLACPNPAVALPSSQRSFATVTRSA